MHVDEASISQDSGVELILTNSKSIVSEYALWFTFDMSNNQAEFEALLASLQIDKELGIKKLKVFTNFQLVAGQPQGDYEA